MYYLFVRLLVVSVLYKSVHTSTFLQSNELANENSTARNIETYVTCQEGAGIIFRLGNEIQQAKPKHSSALYFRQTWMEIELDAVRSNVRELKKYIGSEVHLMAVIKANAYGYGALEISRTAIAAGATWLGVATLDEALAVRVAFCQYIPILVLGYVSPKDLSTASKYRITVTAVSLQWIEEADEFARVSFDFHLKLDTGMNRIGCKTVDEVRSVAKIVSNNQYMNWTGAFTHFATSENVQQKFYYYRQLAIFHKFLDVIPQRENKIIHCANSGAVLLQYEKPYFNMVRLGKALTGPFKEWKHLQPVSLQTSLISLHSTLILVKELKAGEKVGYDGMYTTKQMQWIGTIPIGYADGWHAHLKADTVLINGERVPIVGRIAMDQLMVALPQKYPVGTRVTFIGRQGNATILIDEIERSSKQSRYEIFTAFSSRVPRVYFLDGSVNSKKNSLLENINLMEYV